MTGGPTTEGKLAALLDRIESRELDTIVNVASDLPTALRIVSSHPAVEAVVRACDEDPRLVPVIDARLEDLCRRVIDHRYASPFDSAIFAILFVLNRCEPFFATAKAAATAIDAPNTYWAARLVSSLLADLNRSFIPGVIEESLRPPRLHGRVARVRSRSTLTRPVQRVTFQKVTSHE